MRFEKWQALGNDYVILEREQLPFELTPARVRRLCQPHFGLGADGLLVLSRPEDSRFVARLEIHNPDGSIAELSGNGVREAVLYLRRRGWTDQDAFSIETPAGEIRPRITGPDSCTVDMGHARLHSSAFPSGPPDGRGELAVSSPEPRTWAFQHVNIGNPQCAIAVPDVDALMALDLPALGPAIEAHELFPDRTNVSWYAELSGRQGRIRARIFERGVGETLSSGTGATGAAIAYTLASGRSAGPVTVVLDGGELEVRVGPDLHVELSGWAIPVFEGQLSADFLAELQELE